MIKRFNEFSKMNESSQVLDADYPYSSSIIKLDTDALKLSIDFDEDLWDSKSMMIKELKYLVKNQNDGISDELNDILKPYGFYIDWQSKNHTFDGYTKVVLNILPNSNESSDYRIINKVLIEEMPTTEVSSGSHKVSTLWSTMTGRSNFLGMSSEDFNGIYIQDETIEDGSVRPALEEDNSKAINALTSFIKEYWYEVVDYRFLKVKGLSGILLCFELPRGSGSYSDPVVCKLFDTMPTFLK